MIEGSKSAPCYSQKPVIYLYDSNKGKPFVEGFTDSELDLGLPENSSKNIRKKMDLVIKKPINKEIIINIKDKWNKIFEAHDFDFNEY